MGDVIPFGRAIARAASGPWSRAEVAELNQLARTILANGSQALEVATGFGEAGDPWFVVANTDTGETLLHVARIGGRFVLHHVARGLLAEDPDLRALLRRASPTASPTASVIQMGPGELALLLFAHTALLTQAESAWADTDAAADGITLAEWSGLAGELHGNGEALDPAGVAAPAAEPLPFAGPSGPGLPPPIPGQAMPGVAPPASPGRGGQRAGPDQRQPGPSSDAAASEAEDAPFDHASGLLVPDAPAEVARLVGPEATSTATATTNTMAVAEPAASISTTAQPESARGSLPVEELGPRDPAPIVLGRGETVTGTALADIFVFEDQGDDAGPAILTGFDPSHGDVLILGPPPPSEATEAMPGETAGPTPPGPEVEAEPTIVDRATAPQTWDVGRFRTADGGRWLWIDSDRDADIDLLVELPDAPELRRTVIAALAPEELFVGARSNHAVRDLGIELYGRAERLADRPRRPRDEPGDPNDPDAEPARDAPVDGAEVAGKRWQRFYAEAVQAAIDTQAANDAAGEVPLDAPPAPELEPLPDPATPPPPAWSL